MTGVALAPAQDPAPDRSRHLMVVPETSDATAALIMQSALGAMRLRVLGAELNGVPIDPDHIYDFCLSGLAGRRAPA